MTATSSSQSPSPQDAVQSPLPAYLQRFEQQLPPKREYQIPKLHWKIEDLETKGAERVFLHCTNPVKLLKECIVAIFDLLYTAETCPTHVRSVTVYFRAMDGVAYATGSRLDDDHKEIHFSTDYISKIDEKRIAEEVTGVLQHELVHCFQRNGKGSCPGGLVEGIADWVRLQKGLAPPHWKRTNPSGDWDGGYERTAFFLDWIEQTYGDHFVRRLNESMVDKYEPHIWEDLTGLSVEELWKVYVKAHSEDSEAEKK